MTVPITDISIEDIKTELNQPLSNDFESLFQSTSVIESGLDPVYCSGLSDLRTKPYEIGKWRNYEHNSSSSCNNTVVYPGGQSYPTVININLSSGIGIVNLIPFIDGYGSLVPDRFIVFFNQIRVIDTGYICDNPTSWNTLNSYDRDVFTWGLRNKIDPVLGITYPSLAHFPMDGYPLVGEISTYSFNKNLSNVTQAQVRVYAPTQNTVWNFKLTCPGT